MGRVVSAQTGEALPYATVALSKLGSPADTAGTSAGGAFSMADGTYRLPAAPGTYRLIVSFVTYRTKKSAVFEVKAGAPPVSMDFALIPEAAQIQTIQVTAKVIRDSDAAVLAKQRRAPAVSDGVGANQIAKTSDSNAAEVMQRVTGVSTIAGRYVYVRGLGERYSSTEINGATIGTPEPNRRVVPLDLFASGLLDNVVVQKTYTPDQPGEFGGGVVNISTRDFPGKRIADFSISSGINGSTTGKGFQQPAGGRWDFLGFGDGMRDLPEPIKQLPANQRVQVTYCDTCPGLHPDQIAQLGRSFNKNWTATAKRALPSLGLSGTYGNEVHLFDRPLGVLASFSYSGGRQYSQGRDLFLSPDVAHIKVNTDYQTQTWTSSVLWGALLNSSYRVNDFNTVTLRAMYNRSAEDETRTYQGYNDDWTAYASNMRFDYVDRGLFAGSVSASSFLGWPHGSTLDLRFNYSRANRDEPDRRSYTYTRDDPSVPWTLSAKGGESYITRKFGAMLEEERGPEAVVSLPFKQWSHLDSKLKAGFSYRNKDRDSRWRSFYFKQPHIDSLSELPINRLMADSLISGDNQRPGFILDEATQPTDNYRAHQDVTSEYLMSDLALNSRLRAVGGARVEHARVSFDAWDIFGKAPDEPSYHVRRNNTDVLPSVNLTYTASSATNVRAAFSSTISRPDFRELSQQYMYDFVSGYPEIGNPQLKRARIHNWDLRVENYPGANELLAISVFYKKLIDPIERSLQGANGQLVYKPVNAHSGYLQGAEAEARLGLDRVANPLAPFGLSANYTRVKSDTDIKGLGVETESHRPLQGQSSYVLNLGLFYSRSAKGLSGAVMYNVFGRRLASAGAEGLPDIYEQPRQSLDLTATRPVGPSKLKLSLENLLNQDVRFEQSALRGKIQAGQRLVHSTHAGRGVSLSLSRDL